MSFFSIDNINPATDLSITTSASNSGITIDPHGSGILALGSADNSDVNINALAITATSSDSLTLTDGVASFTLDGTGATSISDATTLGLGCSGAFTINSTAGTIGIGNDVVAQALNIGTGGVRTITVGNTAATAVNIDALAITATSVDALTLTDGSASFTLSGTGATSIFGATTLDLDCSGAFTINSTAGDISIGNNTATQSINIGNGAGLKTITIGSSNTTSSMTLITGSGGFTLTGDATVTGALTVSTISTHVADTGAFLIADSGVIKSKTPAQVASYIGAVTVTDTNIFSAKQSIDLVATTITPSIDGSHFHIEGTEIMTDNATAASGTATIYNQVSVEAVELAADATGVTTTAASTLYITDAPSAGTNQTITNAYALYIAAGAARFDGFLINTHDRITVGDGTTGEIVSTSTGGTVHYPTSSTVFLQGVALSSDSTYHWDLGLFTANGDGSMLNLFFDKTLDSGITALQVNFLGAASAKKLYSGNGLNSSLTFTTTGQSASLIYIDGFWRILNTGATVNV